MRTLVPAETLVYLETNDLAAALQPIVEAKPFIESAKTKPDLSALKGIQLAVAVTGFETKEEVLTDEQSVGRIQPRFVAVAETHAWNYQAVAFAETKLGQFVTDIYGTDVTEERADTANGRSLSWISADGRKSFALVTGSVIYFSNDESAIEKCLAVKRGEADSILKTDKIKPSEAGTLARGYVTTDGVAQIANIVGLKFASEASDESEIQTAIAEILPKLIRGTVTDITWTMTKVEQGIEDKYAVGMPPDVANVFNQTMMPIGENFVSKDFLGIPAEVASSTVYNLKDPVVAMRSVILVATKQTDPTTGRILGEFANLLFEPYGIKDPEPFLTRLGDRIITARTSGDDEMIVLSAWLKEFQYDSKKDLDKNSILPFIEPTIRSAPDGNVPMLVSEDGDMAAVVGEDVIVGDLTLVSKCIETRSSTNSFSDIATYFSKSFVGSKSPVLTIGRDFETTTQIVSTIASPKDVVEKSSSLFATETRFTKSGMERRTISSFGLIGQIVVQLADN